MGKVLIIKGADFSKVAVSKDLFKSYCYGLTDLQFNSTKEWSLPALPYILADNSKYKNKNIAGIRLNVSNVGKITLYKCSTLPISDITAKGEITFEKLFTISTTKTGLQNIKFPSTVRFNDNEYFVFGSEGNTDGDNMRCYYDFNNMYNLKQQFYYINHTGGYVYKLTTNNQSISFDLYTEELE